MRVKNKEIRRRRHRKDQTIKDANRELRAKYGDKKPTATAPKKTASAAKKPSTAASKPKKAEA